MVVESKPVPKATDDEALLLEEALLASIEMLEERLVELEPVKVVQPEHASRPADKSEPSISEATSEAHLRTESQPQTNELVTVGDPVAVKSDSEPQPPGVKQPKQTIEVRAAETNLHQVEPKPDTQANEYPGLNATAGDSGEDAFRRISDAFDDQSPDVRNSAARALFNLNSDRAGSFTRALREGSPERRVRIAQALAASGLAVEAIGNLTGESREKTYDAFSLLFLMAKAGELQPLLQAIEEYPQIEERLAVVKLLALSGQVEIIPAFRRLAVRGALPSEVRSAIVEALYQISSQTLQTAIPDSRDETFPPAKILIRG